ncbi:MAG: DUF3795 domain-containing protein [Candidatus Marinimicrobia bacterium]|nr:DUF3795 domain-containing protein [Candidatus Neomarinimicrobiota bacterium]
MIASMIAPCGMNCHICIGHLREKNQCAGCNENRKKQVEYRSRCTITNCEKLAATESGFCYDCPTYPCARLKQLDTRYRTNYGMSMLENLAFIRDEGMDAFLAHEDKRWTCKHCGAKLSVHRKVCLQCGKERSYQNYEL